MKIIQRHYITLHIHLDVNSVLTKLVNGSVIYLRFEVIKKFGDSITFFFFGKYFSFVIKIYIFQRIKNSISKKSENKNVSWFP